MIALRKNAKRLLFMLAVIAGNAFLLSSPVNAVQDLEDCPMGQGGVDCQDTICIGVNGKFECCYELEDAQCGNDN